MEEKKSRYRIGIGGWIGLIVLATIFDLFTLIPFVGDIASPIFWAIVGVYLWTKGMGIFNGRKLAITTISFIAEMIPAVQELPMLLAGIIAMLVVIRIEDKTGISITKPTAKGVTPPRLKHNPLNNKPGIRTPNIKKASNPIKNKADFPLYGGEM
jgi:hypothetical protein